MSRKDIRKLVRKLVKQGWAKDIGGSGHWRLTAPNGGTMTCSMSPSDPHALDNAKADARRLGAQV